MPPDEHAGPGPGRSPERTALAALCITQATSWGVLFYAFAVLLPRIADEPEWSASEAAACFSGGLLVSAAAGLAVGRWIDRHGPREVMTAGSVIGSLAILGVAGAPNLPVLAAAWLLAGVAMASTFYLPAFAALTRWYGGRRVWALTVLTLAAGLSSFVFAPLTAALGDAFGWRGAYVALAGLLAVVTVPLHWWGLRAPWPAQRTDADTTHADTTHADKTRTSLPAERGVFFALSASLTLTNLTMFGGIIAVVPLLEERGLSPTTAAWALGLGGLGQTLGRLLYGLLAARVPVVPRTVALMAACASTTWALGAVSGPAALLLALSMLAGMVRGNMTLLGATAVPDRWGSRDYGHRSAVLNAPVTVSTALAPFAVTYGADVLGGYPEVMFALAAVAAVAAALALVTGPARVD